MKSHTVYHTFNVPARMGFVNITRHCEDAVKHSGVEEGLLLCNAMHTAPNVITWCAGRPVTVSVYVPSDNGKLKPPPEDETVPVRPRPGFTHPAKQRLPTSRPLCRPTHAVLRIDLYLKRRS